MEWEADWTDEPDEGFEPPKPRRRSWLRRSLRPILTLILVGLFVALLARLFLSASVVVPEASMQPAIPEGAEVMALRLGDPEVGEVVLLRLDRGHAVRRVVAGPGSTVRELEGGIEVDGQRLERQPDDGAFARAQGCPRPAIEQVAGRAVRICEGNVGRRAGGPISLAAQEIYVRCDNRAYCAQHGAPEGRMALDQVVGRVVFLMSLGDDADVPFYERWFGRFEPVP